MEWFCFDSYLGYPSCRVLETLMINDSSVNSSFCSKCTEKAALVFSTVSITIAVLAFIGNIFVVYIVTQTHRMQTCTNWLILNLAIADLAFSLIAIPFEVPIELNKGNWVYAPFFCRIFYPFQTCVIYGSVFTLVCLSVSRYWAVIHPFRNQLDIRGAKFMILIIWIFSILVSLPYALVLSYDDRLKTCREDWSESESIKYTLAIFAFQYVIPLIVILITYTRIAYDLCCSNERQASLNQKKKRSENMKVVKLLIVITVTFAVCLLPYHAVALYYIANPTGYLSKYVMDASFLILYLNSAINPIIYNLFNEKFRKSFREILCKVFCHQEFANTSFNGQNSGSVQSHNESKQYTVVTSLSRKLTFDTEVTAL